MCSVINHNVHKYIYMGCLPGTCSFIFPKWRWSSSIMYGFNSNCLNTRRRRGVAPTKRITKKLVFDGVFLAIVATAFVLYFSSPHTGSSYQRGTPLHTGSSSVRGTGRQRVQILLHTSYRSGSSFFGELFNRNPDFMYIFEPLKLLVVEHYNHTLLLEKLLQTLREQAQCEFEPLVKYAKHLSPSIHGKVRSWQQRIYDKAYTGRYSSVDKGNISIDKGTVHIDKGTISIDKGNIHIDKGNISIDKGIIHIDNGNISIDKMNIRIDNGSINIDKSNISTSEMESACRSYLHVAVKVIRGQGLQYLWNFTQHGHDHVSNIIIALVRDPRAIVMSRYQIERHTLEKSVTLHDWALHATGNTCRKYQSDLTFLHNLRAYNLRHYPTYQHAHTSHNNINDHRTDPIRMLRFEDLAYSPQHIAKQAYAFIGLPLPDAVMTWIEESTTKTMTRPPASDTYETKKRTYGTKRNSAKTAEAWRKTMPIELAQDIDEICGDVMDDLGYLRVSADTYFNQSFSYVRDVDFPFRLH